MLRILMATLIGISAPALAMPDYSQTHSGTLFPGNSGYVDLVLPMRGRGTAGFWVETDRPVTFNLYSYGEIKYNFICPVGVGDCGGNEVFFNSQVGPVTSNTFIQTKLTWHNAYKVGQKTRYMNYGNHQFVFEVPDNQPLTYRITHNFSSQVPEPANWILLLAGFGLVGTGLRRQARPRPAQG